MLSRPKKRSLTLKRHKTSVTLEEEFWQSFQEIASEQKKGINELASEIDQERAQKCGLASAIRLYILNYFKFKKSNLLQKENSN
ncbi:MAG: ribbon-helix-helix domain-containing protein [Rhodobacterales bacterium]|jgi:predicted DNA-binding ribbon-helix-helix protein|tara:strand:- start:1142 stop:1393 length:252 start_codon:yes stop_codon:yes gene_type:complete